MDKQSALAVVKSLVDQGNISKQEVLALFEYDAPVSAKTSKLVEILYYIGAAIVCIGIAVLIGQNWDTLSSFVRILVTLGTGLAAYVVAILLASRRVSEKIAQAFFLIAGVVLPIGLNVAWHEGGYNLSSPGIQTIIMTILLIVFFISWWLYRRATLLLFTTLFGIAFFYVVTSFLLNGRPVFDEPAFTEYRTLFVGLSLALLGYFFSGKTTRALSGSFYAVGVLAFLGSALALGGYKPEQNMFWELIFPLLAFGVIFLSVQVRSKSFLVFGALFLIGYIFKLTAEYFSDSLGWPLALVIAGLLMIAIAYGSLQISKRYLHARG